METMKKIGVTFKMYILAPNRSKANYKTRFRRLALSSPSLSLGLLLFEKNIIGLLIATPCL